MNSTHVTWVKVCAYHNLPQSQWKLDGKHNVICCQNGNTIDLFDVADKSADPDFDRSGSTKYSHRFSKKVQEWHFKAFDVLKSLSHNRPLGTSFSIK
jgi:hypothetical protein